MNTYHALQIDLVSERTIVSCTDPVFLAWLVGEANKAFPRFKVQSHPLPNGEICLYELRAPKRHDLFPEVGMPSLWMERLACERGWEPYMQGGYRLEVVP